MKERGCVAQAGPWKHIFIQIKSSIYVEVDSLKVMNYQILFVKLKVGGI